MIHFQLDGKCLKKYVNIHLHGYTLYKPQRQSECDEVVNLIKHG